MGNRTLVKAIASENCISFRTISRSAKSPHWFYVSRSEFAKLEAYGYVISQDIWSFAILARNVKANLLEIQFTWLNSDGHGVSGREETVTLPYDQLMAFVHDSVQEDGPRAWKMLSIDISKRRPRFMFNCPKTLHAVLNNGVVRRKLVRYLRDQFNWPRSEAICFYGDSAPYSFFFREVRDGQPAIAGGLILHGQDDMSTAYYGIHT